MEAKQILSSIDEAINTYKLPNVQKGDLKSLLNNYSNLLNQYSSLNEEEKISLFDDVKKQRPVIGKKLKESFDKDLQA